MLRRLAACKQAVRVHEGGEHPWAGAGVCCSAGRVACRAGVCSCCGCCCRLGDACCYTGRVYHGLQHFRAEASLHCLTLLLPLLLLAAAGGRFWMCMDLLGSNLTTVRRTLLGGQAELTAAKVG